MGTVRKSISPVYLTMNRLFCLFAAAVALAGSAHAGAPAPEEARDGKAFPIFNIVKFANDVCEGSSRNGTCYTSEECSQLGGTDDGTCADGFGTDVCRIRYEFTTLTLATQFQG